MVDFHKFFDGENIITQQDLQVVAWINVGIHHAVRVYVHSDVYGGV